MIDAVDVQSAVSSLEANRLAELAGGRTVLECGTDYGRSTIAMASTARVVHAVDSHRSTQLEPSHAPETLTWCWANLHRYGVVDRVVLHVGLFEDVLPVLRPGFFDFAFLDGYHDRGAVLRDLDLITPLLLPGSLIACHDYDHPLMPGVRAALEDLGLEVVEVTGTIAVVRTE